MVELLAYMSQIHKASQEFVGYGVGELRNDIQEASCSVEQSEVAAVNACLPLFYGQGDAGEIL